MVIQTLELTNFRIYEQASLHFHSGFTVIYGDNGQGKTSLFEAISWIGGLGSFRGVADDALIRNGTNAAIIRSTTSASSNKLIEVELPRAGRNRVQINRQPCRKIDLAGVVPLTIFSPDDLEFVKGSPSLRRRWLDDVAANVYSNHSFSCNELEKIVRQRNALLRSCKARPTNDDNYTLDVWDARLLSTAEAIYDTRKNVLTELEPHLTNAYDSLAGTEANISTQYQQSWQGDLAVSLKEARMTDLQRGVTTVGPHRDEIGLFINNTPARTHASQGEQRSLALAMRLATDALIRHHTNTAPILLLDDVFSELDNKRAQALLEALPQGQQMLTTASDIPTSAKPDQLLKVSVGKICDLSL